MQALHCARIQSTAGRKAVQRRPSVQARPSVTMEGAHQKKLQGCAQRCDAAYIHTHLCSAWDAQASHDKQQCRNSTGSALRRLFVRLRPQMVTVAGPKPQRHATSCCMWMQCTRGPRHKGVG